MDDWRCALKPHPRRLHLKSYPKAKLKVSVKPSSRTNAGPKSPPLADAPAALLKKLGRRLVEFWWLTLSPRFHQLNLILRMMIQSAALLSSEKPSA